MKLLTIGSCVLLAGMASIAACNKLDNQDLTLKTHAVHITNCEPDKETVKVKNADQIEWFADDNGYEITFDKNVPPNTTNEPIPNNKVDVPQGSSVKVPVNGHNKCSTLGCYYKYNLARLKNGLPETILCNDPGVRIVP